MRTKEEILSKRIVRFPSDGVMTDDKIKTNVYSAMDEYAKERSIAFAEWVILNYVPTNTGYMHKCGNLLTSPRFSLAELYELFTKENQEK